MTGVIVYRSSYGSTRQYAEWLGEETGFDVVDVRSVRDQDLRARDVVIVGCPVLAYKPLLAKWITKKWPVLSDKKVVLFTTSGAAPEDPSLRKGFEASFEPSIRSKIQYVPQGGRMVISKLKPMHRLMMRMGQRMEKDPVVREAMGQDKDHVNREGLRPILESLAGERS